MLQVRNTLNQKVNLTTEKRGDMIEVGVELETHFNNESNIGYHHDATNSVDRPSISIN